MSSALTLNQNPFDCSPPPNGLERLEPPKADAPGEEMSFASRRRMSSVISSEPIQTRRTSSMLTILASACSCCGVQVVAGAAAARGQFRVAAAAKFLDGPCQRQVFAHGGLDDFNQRAKEVQSGLWRTPRRFPPLPRQAA